MFCKNEINNPETEYDYEPNPYICNVDEVENTKTKKSSYNIMSNGKRRRKNSFAMIFAAERATKIDQRCISYFSEF
ncbi:hypothetical protein WA026_023354 [Henosepilachna vigintioctopunctata]|uniref:Uncharacterized protein n=1 Tax=Henosepilachna vigintioctopunctata TaxID=420089 RepID=A0AAW1VBK3_9CUCU